MTGNDDSSRKLQPVLAPRSAALPPALRPSAPRVVPPLLAAPPVEDIPDDEADTQDMPVLELSASEEDAQIWPGNVPGNDAAHAFLRDPKSAGSWEPITSVLLAALSEAERGVLREPVLPPQFIGLRTAVLFRWRLAAMLATAPRTAGAPLDHAALEAVLVESDDVLSGLRMPEGMHPTAVVGFDSARASVARDVVTLADLTHKLQPPSPELLAEQAAQAERARAASQARVAATAKKLTFEPQKAKVAPRKGNWLYIVGAVVLVAGAGYHAFNYLQRPGPESVKAVFADVPEGALGNNDLAHDVLTFQVIPGRTLRAEQLEALRAKAAATGKVFKELAPGFYFVGPLAQVPHAGTKP